jgi:uncharacterized protein
MVKVDRFRPNIVLKGGGPFAEDVWEEIIFHSVKGADPSDAGIAIQIVSKCTRCLVSNTVQLGCVF